MKKSIFSIFVVFSVLCPGYSLGLFKDSLNLPSIKYSKLELKKETNDLKILDKQIKEWNKALKKLNADYLNTLYSRILETLYKEHQELSTKISARSKKLQPGPKMNEKDSLLASDKPKAYNPELQDQPARISKEQILRQKTESDYLSKYVALVKAESNLLLKFKNVELFTNETPSTVFATISEDLKQFRAKMQTELDLMKPETSRK